MMMRRGLALLLAPLVALAACAPANAKVATRSKAKDLADLRAEGHAGLERLLEQYDGMKEGAARRALARSIDKVAGQRYAHVSRLYWYTDLEEAKLAAREAKKPILSLRMLGRLDEDLSCVNSRFFRVALYGNVEVATLLRDQFILHWSSERPAARVTVDFGDGRKLETTVGGNSAHYVLDAQGRVVDVLPGLYAPAVFRRELAAARDVALAAGGLDGAERAKAIAAYHQGRVKVVQEAWQAAAAQGLAGAYITSPNGGSLVLQNGTIMEAEYRTMGKGAVERPLVRAAQLGPRLVRVPDESPVWQQIGTRFAADAKLDERSRTLMRSLEPSDWTLASKPLDDNAFATLLAAFEARVAADTALNEYKLRWQIHAWFIADGAGQLASFEAVNEKIYSELFLTPRSDAWLGMATRDAFTGLPRDGIVLAAH